MDYRFLRFPDGKEKAVTFSYDDGTRSDLRLAGRLQYYNLRCTFNLSSSWLSQKNHLTPEEIEKEILPFGHEIAVHGEMHKAEGIVRAIEGIRDVLQCRLALEKHFGRIIRGMAYPDCGITRFAGGMSKDRIKTYLRDLDIVYARSLGADNDSFDLPEDWLEWIPTVHHGNPDAISYAEQFVALDIQNAYTSQRGPRLFYLWGHSYEFDDNNNWPLLDAICKRLSGHDNIWYATNMEIYEYVCAYHCLIYSADGTIITNPTLLTVWFDYNGQLYSVLPGQTIRL